MNFSQSMLCHIMQHLLVYITFHKNPKKKNHKNTCHKKEIGSIILPYSALCLPEFLTHLQNKKEEQKNCR